LDLLQVQRLEILIFNRLLVSDAVLVVFSSTFERMSFLDLNDFSIPRGFSRPVLGFDWLFKIVPVFRGALGSPVFAFCFCLCLHDDYYAN
jgi:hypothetical protein